MEDCPICLEPCERDFIVAECCRKHFHTSCHTQCMKVNGKCPTCRHVVIVIEQEEDTEQLVEVRVPLRIPWFIIATMMAVAMIGFFIGFMAYLSVDQYLNQGLNNTTSSNVTISDVHN